MMTPKPRGVHRRGTPFYREWELGDEFLEHRHGISWHDAEMPDVWHRCESQTRGIVRVGGLPPMSVERCRCGGVNVNAEGWEERNSRTSKVAR